MKVLVTGGSGLIGGFVIPELQKIGDEVQVFDLVEPQGKNIPFIKGDVNDVDALNKALKRVEAVIHLAAIPVDTGQAEKLFKVNFEGTFHVLEAAARNGVRKVLFMSSICTIVHMKWAEPFVWKTPFVPFTPLFFPVTEDHPVYAGDLYGVSKCLGENLCQSYSKQYGLSSICLRLASVWFPSDSPRARRLAKSIVKPELATDRIWAYVDARDVAQAIRLCLHDRNEEKYAVYNIGAEDVIGGRDTLELVKEYYPHVKSILKWDEFVANRSQALWDISKAKKELGYKPEWTWREYVPFSSEG